MTRVLLVAPHTNLLLVDEEVEEVIRSGLEVTPLLGKVNHMDLVKEIRAGDYDVLWLATHGDSDGVQLSDGIWTATELLAQVRDRFDLVFLNTCSSFKLARRIQEEANITCVGTIIDVPDKLAFETGSLFAGALAAGMPYGMAYKDSIAGGDDRVYVYLAPLSPSQDSIDTVLKKLESLQTIVVRQRTWERRALIAALALHPVTWLVMYLMWWRF